MLYGISWVLGDVTVEVASTSPRQRLLQNNSSWYLQEGQPEDKEYYEKS